MNSLAKNTPVLPVLVCELFCSYFCLDELISIGCPLFTTACLWTLLFIILCRWTHWLTPPLFYCCISVNTYVHNSVQMNSLTKTTPVLLLCIFEHFCWYFCLDELINHYTSLWTTISWCVGLSFPRGASVLVYSWVDEVTHRCVTKMTVTKMKLYRFFFYTHQYSV